MASPKSTSSGLKRKAPGRTASQHAFEDDLREIKADLREIKAGIARGVRLLEEQRMRDDVALDRLVVLMTRQERTEPPPDQIEETDRQGSAVRG